MTDDLFSEKNTDQSKLFILYLILEKRVGGMSKINEYNKCGIFLLVTGE